MKAFAKLVLIACGVVAAIIFIGLVTEHSPSREANSTNNPSADTAAGADTPATYPDGYDPASNEVFLPYELSKNPYKWKGQSGILDTLNTAYVMPNGSAAQMGLALGSIKFDKMLDEHTAIYDVMTIQDTLTPDGQIAVILPDSDPPDLRRPWRVLVIGSLDGTNAFGGNVTVAAVKFEQYYTPLPKPAETEPAPTPISSQEPSAATQSIEPTGTWTPLSHTADAITGELSISGNMIAISGTSYPLATVHMLNASEIAIVTETFSLQPNQTVDARLYRTSIPEKATMLGGNRICGSGDAQWIVALTTPDANSSLQLNLMFLSGDLIPSLDADTLAHSGRLCGTYSYQRATGTNGPN